MHVLTLSYTLIYALSVKVDTWFVPTAAELRGIRIGMNLRKIAVWKISHSAPIQYQLIESKKKER